MSSIINNQYVNTFCFICQFFSDKKNERSDPNFLVPGTVHCRLEKSEKEMSFFKPNVVDLIYIFQTMHSVRSYSQSLKNQRITLLGWKDPEVYKFEFVEKTQFLSWNFFYYKKNLRNILVMRCNFQKTGMQNFKA